MTHPLDRYPARTVRCPACGAEMLDGDNRCPDDECPSNAEEDDDQPSPPHSEA